MAKDHHLHLSEKPFSLLQSNELFVNKILSRNSSFGLSARLPSCRLPGQIPFNWEAQPGLPKDQPSENPPPADLPPPAGSSEGLSKAHHIVPKQEPVKIWLWKKPKRKVRNVVVKKNSTFGSSRRHVDRENEFCRKSNDEPASASASSSSCISYSLSSSSSGSTSNGYGRRRRSKLGSLAKGFIRWAF